MGIFCPDLPVPKSRDGERASVADVSINDGLHMNEIIVANQWGRIAVTSKVISRTTGPTT